MQDAMGEDETRSVPTQTSPQHAPSTRWGAARVHPSAVVSEGASLGPGVEVGPFAVIGAGAQVGAGCVLSAHCVIEGVTRLGPGCVVHPFAVLGGAPQTRGASDSAGGHLELGAGVVVREFVTLNRGSQAGGGVTRIGDRALIMAYSHVGHDCTLGADVVLSNNATLAGHVHIGAGAVLGGMSAIQQFVRVGRLAFLAGGGKLEHDLPPFLRAAGDRARLVGLNRVGLRRAGVSKATQSALRDAYRQLFRSAQRAELARREVAVRSGDVPEVSELLEFLETATRGVCRGRPAGSPPPTQEPS